MRARLFQERRLSAGRLVSVLLHLHFRPEPCVVCRKMRPAGSAASGSAAPIVTRPCEGTIESRVQMQILFDAHFWVEIYNNTCDHCLIYSPDDDCVHQARAGLSTHGALVPLEPQGWSSNRTMCQMYRGDVSDAHRREICRRQVGLILLVCMLKSMCSPSPASGAGTGIFWWT